MPPFQQRPPQLMFRNAPSFFSPQAAPVRGFPSLFPGMSSAPMPAVPAAPASGAGGLPGLLSSLFSPGTAAAQSGGGMNLFGMLMNAQKAIQTAQTVLPMVQQFGPLIKNAPAIISILKSMQASEETASKEKKDSDETAKEETENGAEAESALEQAETKKSDSGKKEKAKTVRRKRISWDSEEPATRPSKPRMYI